MNAVRRIGLGVAILVTTIPALAAEPARDAFGDPLPEGATPSTDLRASSPRLARCSPCAGRGSPCAISNCAVGRVLAASRAAGLVAFNAFEWVGSLVPLVATPAVVEGGSGRS